MHDVMVILLIAYFGSSMYAGAVGEIRYRRRPLYGMTGIIVAPILIFAAGAAMFVLGAAMTLPFWVWMFW